MSTSPPHPVIRVVRRHAKPGCEPEYEALVGGMLQDAGKVTGFISGQLIPPEGRGGLYQTIMQFESDQAVEVWNRSDDRRTWHQLIDAVADDEPEYQHLTGLEAWFARPSIGGRKPPARWKMAIVTWVGIYAIVMLLQVLLPPLITDWNFFLRNALFTIFVTLLATYVVMPQLVKVFRRWLERL